MSCPSEHFRSLSSLVGSYSAYRNWDLIGIVNVGCDSYSEIRLAVQSISDEDEIQAKNLAKACADLIGMTFVVIFYTPAGHKTANPTQQTVERPKNTKGLPGPPRETE